MRTWIAKLVALVFLLLMPFGAMAQAPSGAATDQNLLKPQELDALVAPIALYPDPLLAEVLMASTYPLEVVQADRWINDDKNKRLKDDQLKRGVDKQPWDESVKSLVATPSVLSMMSGKLDWTQKLGDAVLAQQPDVMDAVQRLRAKAQANNKLQTTKEQKVTVTQGSNNKQTIAIEPATPDTLYVPYYDPAVVYGDWPYPDYPAYYFPPAAGWIATGVVATGIAFGAGYALGRWRSGGRYWGGGFNWAGNDININRGNINVGNNVGNRWQHNPQHRGGVRYNNANVQQRFGNTARTGNRTNIGDRQGAGNRTGAGGAGGNRPQQHTAKKAGKGAGKGANRQAPTRKAGSGAGAGARHSASAGARVHAGGGGAALRAGGGGHARMSGAGGMRGAGGMHGGGGMRGGGGRGGGRRSDIRLKHDITLLGYLANGLGFYRFVYNGGSKAFVGVMAQEVQTSMPQAVYRGQDGYLRVRYEQLGLNFQTYDHWLASGARIPVQSGCLCEGRRL